MFGTSHKKRQNDKIAALRQSLKQAQEARDKHKGKLVELGRIESYLRANRLALKDLFIQHIKPHFCATPTTKELSSHISHKEGLQLGVPGDGWLLTGYVCAVQLKDLLQGVLGPAFQPKRVMDFGCGSARTTRYLPILPGVESLYGCDIDPSAIEWLNSLPDLKGTFFQVGDRPPLPADLPPLDLVLAQSVFTHLPLDLETEWLAALQACLAPGGVMVLTFHGASFDRFVPDAWASTLERDGFLHCNIGLTPGLPDYYQTSFHTEAYIKNEWSRYGKVLAIREFGFEGQDVAVIQKPW